MTIKMEMVNKKTYTWSEIGKQLAKLSGTKSLKIIGDSHEELEQIQKGVYWYAKTRLSFKVTTEFQSDKILIVSKIDGRIKNGKKTDI